MRSSCHRHACRTILRVHARQSCKEAEHSGAMASGRDAIFISTCIAPIKRTEPTHICTAVLSVTPSCAAKMLPQPEAEQAAFWKQSRLLFAVAGAGPPLKCCDVQSCPSSCARASVKWLQCNSGCKSLDPTRPDCVADVRAGHAVLLMCVQDMLCC